VTRAKLTELVPSTPADELHEHVPEAYRSAVRLMMIEGRLREALQGRWPLLQEFIGRTTGEQESEHIDIGSKRIELRDARTVFFLLPDAIDVVDDIHLFNDKLRGREEYYYNCHRPHGALDGPDTVAAISRGAESGNVTGVSRTWTLPFPLFAQHSSAGQREQENA
jgi:hypothetical protein